MYSKFKKQNGSINNIEEMIDAFELPTYSPDILLMNDIKIAEINTNTFKVEFLSDELREKFAKEVKSSGLLEKLKSELEIDEAPENLLVIAAANKSLDDIKFIYEEEKQNSILSFINKIVNKTPKQDKKLEIHRNKLKRTETSRSRKI